MCSEVGKSASSGEKVCVCVCVCACMCVVYYICVYIKYKLRKLVVTLKSRTTQ